MQCKLDGEKDCPWRSDMRCDSRGITRPECFKIEPPADSRQDAKRPGLDGGAMPGSAETLEPKPYQPTPNQRDGIIAPQYGEGGSGPFDITRSIEQKISRDLTANGGPINGHNCVRGNCPLLGEHCGNCPLLGEHCGTHGDGVFDELWPCVWGAAAMGDQRAIDVCVKYHMEESGMTPEQIEEQRQSWARSCVSKPGDRQAMPVLPAGRQERKDMPIYSGVLAYFPRALGAVATLSKVGNDIHNPGEPLHWSKGKSTDHLDCVARHLIENGATDDQGVYHDVMLAWRALANLEIFLEAQALGITKDELIRRYQEEEKRK